MAPKTVYLTYNPHKWTNFQVLHGAISGYLKLLGSFCFTFSQRLFGIMIIL